MVGMKCDGCGAHIAVKHLSECPRCYVSLQTEKPDILTAPSSKGWMSLLTEFSWTGLVITIVLTVLLVKATILVFW